MSGGRWRRGRRKSEGRGSCDLIGWYVGRGEVEEELGDSGMPTDSVHCVGARMVAWGMFKGRGVGPSPGQRVTAQSRAL